MLIGYVSDEYDLALSDVAVELIAGTQQVAVTHSSPTGAIHADVPPGRYRIVLARPGFGAKHVDVDLPDSRRFRLLSDRVYGYVWPKWVQAGTSAELRVHSVEQYRADLYRYGQTKEHVRPLGWFDEHGPRAMTQTLPDADVTQTGAGWNQRGFTSPGHVPRVVAPDQSGLYYVHIRTESGQFTSLPWVVAPSSPQSRIAVLASTNTWNAYNNFGGRSNYINANGIPSQPTVNSRLDLARYVEGNPATHAAGNDSYPPLSFDRPEPCCAVGAEVQATDPAAGRLASSLAPGLWRLLAWMTREGYNHDLYADAQLDNGELDLDAYSVLVLDAHPEYWSRGMYEHVRDWVFERGGKLAYLGGNGIDCEVDYVRRDAAIYRTHQSTSDNTREPFVESRFHRTVESQSRLLGVAFTPSGEGTAAPFEVIEPRHWVFAGTGLCAGDLFGEHTLHERVPGGASGHETDKRTGHGPDTMAVLAKGRNPDGGGAEMVHFVTGSGGEVFSVGSMTYIASLLIDPQVSRITSNVLSRFLAS